MDDLARAEIGILGGTGLYEIEGMSSVKEIAVDTPFGEASDTFFLGKLEGKKVAFLSRHGRGHRFLPSDINYRANIYGFKKLGVERIISINSVGSLKEEIQPRDFVLSDQFFDRTRRKNTFFGDGIAAHISFAHPVCSELSKPMFQTGKELKVRIHGSGTYLCMEGPSFSTKAESHAYRSWGCDVIGMTSATEAHLAREAEICYVTLNLVTDYDVWHEEEEGVSIELILENLKKNIHNAKEVLKQTLRRLPHERSGTCDCASALSTAIVTHKDAMPEKTKEKLRLLIDKYI